MKIQNAAGLSFEFLENGAVRCIEAGPVRISLKPASPFSFPGSNIFLRKRSKTIEYKALLGPESDSLFNVERNVFIARGNWDGLDYDCVLMLSNESSGWQWSIDVSNRTGDPVELDLVCLQDAGLKPVTDGLINEYYVSQYIERRILEDETHGPVIFCRQNMSERAENPWLMLVCKNRAASACTDGMQFYGPGCRGSGIPEGLVSDELGGEYAGESSVLALQEQPFRLIPGDHHCTGFAGLYMPDHPAATSAKDLGRIPGLLSEFKVYHRTHEHSGFSKPVRNVFNIASFLPVDDLSSEELDRFFGEERRHPEVENGQLLSFFHGENNHVMLRTKELLADRPHAHIMQAEAGFVPDENIVSTTAWASGIFNSHLTQGNTNFNNLLSICTTPFNLSLETGQRIIVEINGRKYLPGVPSAFEIGLNHCRWIYRHGEYLFEMRTWTSKRSPRVNMDFKVLSGGKVNLLVTHHFDDLNGWHVSAGNQDWEYIVKPEAGSMIAARFPGAQFRILVNSRNDDLIAHGDEVLYEDLQSRGAPFFILDIKETTDFCMSFIGEVKAVSQAEIIENADDQWLSDCRDAQSDWKDLGMNISLKGENKDVSAIQEILPWYGMNAMTHYLTPYGLEQFSGAAWGTRDVAQGPFDLLLCMEKYSEAKEVLRTIFSNQDPGGGWPQWWMFDSYSDIRADSSHGDVFYWCIIALCNYINVTGDHNFLDEILPYYHEKGPGRPEKQPLTEHIDRLIKMIVDSFIPGTSLVPFGGGDWNDSLQPVSKDLARRMISSWTVEMNYQAFSRCREVYERLGMTEKARNLLNICSRIKADFNRFLVKDEVVAGYGLVEEDGTIGLLFHPSDNRTGVRYSILPMNRGIISGIFSKSQVRHHQDLVEEYLKGPDGARLMDRPLRYKGGVQSIFQRAESSTFFGREIGLMYIHEHVRYAESLALTGKAEEFIKALRQANPVSYREIVPCGDIRQSNCYYSSSDVAFRSRYEADELYDEIGTGAITLRGGWRVYSSGPGIYIALVVTRLLGIRVDSGKIIIDPVIPQSMDGLTASMQLMGQQVTLVYSVNDGCFGPRSISINGKTVPFTCEENMYRKGGAVIPAGQFTAMLDREDNIIEIEL